LLAAFQDTEFEAQRSGCPNPLCGVRQAGEPAAQPLSVCIAEWWRQVKSPFELL